MNKKVSTILTCGLMLGGSLLSSSAFAKEIQFPLGTESVDAVTNGTEVVFAQAFGTEKYVLGFDRDANNGNLIVSNVIWVGHETIDEAKLNNYKWKVLVSQSDVQKTPLYTFVNVATGDTLAFNDDNTLWTKGTKDSYAKDKKYSFQWTSASEKVYNSGSALATWDAKRRFFSAKDVEAGINNAIELHDAGNTANLLSSLANSTVLAKIAETPATGEDDLNALYNNKGFNLTAGEDVDDNLFEGDTRIWAYELDVTNSDGTKGYKISAADANGKDLFIPNGLYFFTNRVLKDGVTTVSSAADIDWLASTLIAVSPETTVESTVNDRDKGQGFKLITAKLEDFIFQENTSEYVVGEMPIENACFNAMYNNAGKYAIRLDSFYYKKNSNDAAGTKLEPAKVDLVVLNFTDGTKSLSTTPAGDAYDYIFSLSDSSIKDGIELLNKEKKAAVYNIKFVGGTSDDAELIGKYLTVGVKTDANEVASNTEFDWVAKGSDIAKLNYPSFQYTITAVAKEAGKENDKDAKYVNVTFTNRETNESFTAKLFPEEGGTNYYSLAFIGDEEVRVKPVNVKRNSYGVEEAKTTDIKFDENIIIELIPSTVDEYAGFLNVADKSVRTIRLARDKFDTSYMWYVGVEDNSLYDGNDGIFYEDAYDAAQFQLVKTAEKPSTIARTYVYNAGTGSVNDVVNGDKVSAYVYKLQYLNDGTETGYYLADKGAQGPQLAQDGNDKDDEFIIKENADGSVSLFRSSDAFVSSTSLQVTSADKNVSIDAKVTSDSKYAEYLNAQGSEHRSAIYAYTSSDMNLKTYLDDEIDNMSWDEEGHVTLQNGTEGVIGNYISVNESNEAVVVNAANETLYLHMTDEDAVVPSFYISKGMGEGSNALSERLFLFNPTDSVNYLVNAPVDPKYQVAKEMVKAIFKAGTLDESRDTMTISVKGEVREIAQKSDNDGTWAGLERFKWQIIESADADGYYNIRQVGGYTKDAKTYKTGYLASHNEKLYITDKKDAAMSVYVEGVDAPTANEGVSATDVKVVAYDGAINIKNAAGKNVVVSTILGQIVANEVLTSDNATISVPAGIAIVSVDGEEAVKVSVK